VAGAAAVAAVVILAVARLSAPGPPGFYIEPVTGMMLVAVRPGTFTMGSPESEIGRQADETPHRVTLPEVFYVGQHEVTQAAWTRVMGSNPSASSGCERCPVEHVNFYEVNDFLSRLNAGTRAMRFRLPTEREWEYACRAGTTTPFNTGQQLTTDQANVDGRYPSAGGAPGVAREKTEPVGSFPPNGWGLFDMHGNVWEWTNDWYGPYDTERQADPRGAETGQARVIRGGSWHVDANSARCALRFTHAPQDRGPSLGFRVVAEPVRSRARD
jgi:formylglycine-generating enzyme required for sulfatase activity